MTLRDNQSIERLLQSDKESFKTGLLAALDIDEAAFDAYWRELRTATASTIIQSEHSCGKEAASRETTVMNLHRSCT